MRGGHFMLACAESECDGQAWGVWWTSCACAERVCLLTGMVCVVTKRCGFLL
jgi:hypothetical protein